MLDYRQEIFPICSYGRAENIYYHSKYALCPKDLTREEVVKRVEEQKIALFPSHLLDRADWEELLREISALEVKPRVQFALGREWEILQTRVLRAVALGWGLDVLVDRPMTQLQLPAQVEAVADRRWVICPIHFYDVLEVASSLKNLNDGKKILLSFLEPNEAKSLLCSPDETMSCKKRILDSDTLRDHIDILILRSTLQQEEGFYQNPSFSTYQKQFPDLGKFKKARSAYQTSVEKYPVLTISFVEILKFQIHALSNPLFWRTSFSLRKLKIFSEHVWFFFRNILFSFGFRCRSVFVGNYFRLRNALLYGLKFCAHRFKSFLLFQLFHGMSFVRHRALPFIFWPLYKIYWMAAYEYKTRVLPLIKKD